MSDRENERGGARKAAFCREKKPENLLAQVLIKTYYGIAAVANEGTTIAQEIADKCVYFDSYNVTSSKASEVAVTGCTIYVYEYTGNVSETGVVAELEEKGTAVGSGVQIGTNGSGTLLANHGELNLTDAVLNVSYDADSGWDISVSAKGTYDDGAPYDEEFIVVSEWWPTTYISSGAEYEWDSECTCGEGCTCGTCDCTNCYYCGDVIDINTITTACTEIASFIDLSDQGNLSSAIIATSGYPTSGDGCGCDCYQSWSFWEGMLELNTDLDGTSILDS